MSHRYEYLHRHFFWVLRQRLNLLLECLLEVELAVVGNEPLLNLLLLLGNSELLVLQLLLVDAEVFDLLAKD